MCASVSLAPSLETATYGVVLHNRGRVQVSLESIAKRASRRGLPVPTWTWGGVSTGTERHAFRSEEYPDMIVEREVRVTRIELVLSTVPVRYAGWHFLAAITHLGDGAGNLVRTIEGKSCPVEYRDAAGNCDHCKARRNRSETYVLRHEDGRISQVGSTCIRDFLGGEDAIEVALLAQIVADLRRVADVDGSDMGGFGRSGDEALALYLPFVACLVRTDGWVSRTAARESIEGRQATADLANTRDVRKDCEVSDEDTATALASIAWASELSDERILSETGDYLHNVRAVARLGYVSGKTMGIAASIVVAYQREQGRIRLAAERASRPMNDAHVGTVGDKVSFGLAPKVGKKGQPLKGAPVVLSAEPLVLEFVTGYETSFGYTTVLKFRSAEGALIVWKASAEELPGRGDVGKSYTLTGKIKAHDEYKGAKQTMVSNCKLVVVEA